MDTSELLPSKCGGAGDKKHRGGNRDISNPNCNLQAESHWEMVLWGRGQQDGGKRGRDLY